MNKSDLSRAVNLLFDVDPAGDLHQKLVVAAYLKDGKYDADDVKEWKRALVEDEGVDASDLTGWKPGVLMRASDLTEGYYVWEGDLAMLPPKAEGIYSYYFVEPHFLVRPEDYSTSGMVAFGFYPEDVYDNPLRAAADIIKHADEYKPRRR